VSPTLLKGGETMINCELKLLIPDYDPEIPVPYPGDIKPGYYSPTEIAALLQTHHDNPEALQFLRDMQEE